MNAIEPKKKRNRFVYGRIEWHSRNGDRVIFEQTEFGVMVRSKHSKQESKIFTFRELWQMAVNEQPVMI
jgi:hypothetical protein